MSKKQVKKPEHQEKLPARELSQASVASFIYGTLQLILTLIGGAVIIAYSKVNESFTALVSPNIESVPEGTDIEGTVQQITELTDMLGIDTPDIPTSTGLPATPDLSPFTPQSSVAEITSYEWIAILVTSPFGILGILTAIFAFMAIAKGKHGNGLAVTGFMSSGISLILASMVALTV